MSTIKKRAELDPRIIRTRRLLFDSFAALLAKQRSIQEISVQDIADQAGVNRVTFYSHFADKYELLNAWKREMFRQFVKEKSLVRRDSHDVTVEDLVSAALDFSILYHRLRRPVNKEFEPVMEAAVQQEIKTILVQILDTTKARREVIATEDMATFLSSALFASANEWSREHKRISKKAKAKQLMSLIEKVIGR
jgi:AcrR family transcriptional regulator